MRDSLDIGSGPPMEDCAQLGQEGYREQALAECRGYIAAIKKKLGEPPPGLSLRVKSNPHDFGCYYSVVAEWEDGDHAAMQYAYKAESEGPDTWFEVDMERPMASQGRSR